MKEYVIRIHAAEIETNSVINEIETNSVINADERKGGGGGQIQVRRARNNLSKNVSFVNIKMDCLKYNIETLRFKLCYADQASGGGQI